MFIKVDRTISWRYDATHIVNTEANVYAYRTSSSIRAPVVRQFSILYRHFGGRPDDARRRILASHAARGDRGGSRRPSPRKCAAASTRTFTRADSFTRSVPPSGATVVISRAESSSDSNSRTDEAERPRKIPRVMTRESRRERGKSRRRASGVIRVPRDYTRARSRRPSPHPQSTPLCGAVSTRGHGCGSAPGDRVAITAASSVALRRYGASPRQRLD